MAEAVHHITGDNRDKREADEPAHAAAKVEADAGVEVGNLRLLTTDRGEFFDVLGGFLLENFERVVVGQHAEEVVEFIDHRQHDQVVF